MYIIVMDYSTNMVTKLVSNEEVRDVEALLMACGYHLSQIAYMVSDDEPEFGLVEVSDILTT